MSDVPAVDLLEQKPTAPTVPVVATSKPPPILPYPKPRKPPARSPRNAGRPTHRAEQVPDEVLSLIRIAQDKEPQHVAQWLRRKLNAHLDEELEVLATHVLSEADFEEVLTLAEVRGPLSRNDTDTAIRAVVSRMKRKFAKLLRDHERSENDDFLDTVQVVD